ncbi:MAG: hypothetical protein KF905_13750 [Flavobacteriales bacterium]|nr:hypothetical protein [Flavobacteriales bacterium]
MLHAQNPLPERGMGIAYFAAMLRKLYTTLLTLSLGLALYAQPTPDLLLGIGGTGADEMRACVVDASGNLYVTGLFNSTVDMDPGPSSTTITSAGEADIFVLKYAPTGNLLWARGFGGPGPDMAFGIALDPQGNVLVSGGFQQTATFGSGGPSITSQGDYDVFVLKLDPQGNVLWVRSFGGSTYDASFSVAADAQGNVVVTGYFTGTVDMDPGPGSFPLTTAGSADAFIVKLDPQGGFLWARQFGGTGNDQVDAVAVHADGRVVVTGRFTNTANVGPGPGLAPITSQGNSDFYLLELNAQGDPLRLIGLGGTGFDAAFCLALLPDGAVLLGGSFSLTMDFDPGPGEVPMTVGGIAQNAFVLKLTSDLQFEWVKQFSSNDYSRINSLAVDAVGNVHLTGGFNGTLDLDPGPGQELAVVQGLEDAPIVSLSPSGELLAGGVLTNMNFARGLSVAVAPNGQVWAGGQYQSVTTLQYGGSNFSISHAGSADFYLLRLDQCPQDMAFGTLYTSLDGATLFVDDLADAYQWIDCTDNSPIAGATGPSYTATANGSYAVALTAGPCVFTTICQAVTTVGIAEGSQGHGLLLFPNPTSDQVSLHAGVALRRAHLTVFDPTGRVLRSMGPVQGERVQVDLSGLAAGALWVEVREAGQPPVRLPFVLQR